MTGLCEMADGGVLAIGGRPTGHAKHVAAIIVQAVVEGSIPPLPKGVAAALGNCT